MSQKFQEFVETVKDFEAYVSGLELELEEAKTELSDAEDKITELEMRVEELEGKDEYEKVLEIYADSSNWNGTHFAPLLRYQQTSDPWEYADRVLKI